MITVKELRALLATADDDMLVLIQNDGHYEQADSAWLGFAWPHAEPTVPGRMLGFVRAGNYASLPEGPELLGAVLIW